MGTLISTSLIPGAAALHAVVAGSANRPTVAHVPVATKAAGCNADWLLDSKSIGWLVTQFPHAVRSLFERMACGIQSGGWWEDPAPSAPHPTYTTALGLPIGPFGRRLVLLVTGNNHTPASAAGQREWLRTQHERIRGTHPPPSPGTFRVVFYCEQGGTTIAVGDYVDSAGRQHSEVTGIRPPRADSGENELWVLRACLGRGHVNLVEMIDVCSSGRLVYVRWYAGGRLSDGEGEGGGDTRRRYTERQLHFILTGACDGLRYLHERLRLSHGKVCAHAIHVDPQTAGLPLGVLGDLFDCRPLSADVGQTVSDVVAMADTVKRVLPDNGPLLLHDPLQRPVVDLRGMAHALRRSDGDRWVERYYWLWSLTTGDAPATESLVLRILPGCGPRLQRARLQLLPNDGWLAECLRALLECGDGIRSPQWEVFDPPFVAPPSAGGRELFAARIHDGESPHGWLHLFAVRHTTSGLVQLYAGGIDVVESDMLGGLNVEHERRMAIASANFLPERKKSKKM